MIELCGDKIGHPWHGLYRASTGKIETPAGGDIDLPGSAPDSGNCWLVQIPDLPEPETTPEEAAAGRTWTNYALISDQKIYGRGISGPLYIDTAGRAWALTIFRSGSRATKLLTVNISAKRFGEIGAGTAPTTALPSMSVAFETHADYPAESFELSGGFLLDVAKNGAKLLFGVTRRRGIAAVAEVTLTGSPADGNFSGSIALLADESTIDEWDAHAEESSGRYWIGLWREFDWSAPPSPHPSGNLPASPSFYSDINGVRTAFNGSAYATHLTYTWEMQVGGSQPASVGTFDDGYMSSVFTFRPIDIIRPGVKWLAGARYGADWVAALVVATVKSRTDYDAPVFDGAPHYGPLGLPMPPLGPVASSATCKVTAEIKAGSETVDLSEQSVFTATPDDYSHTMTLTRNGVFISSISYNAYEGGSYSAFRFGAWINPATFITSTSFANRDIGVRRVSNSIYQSRVPGLQIYGNPGAPIVLESARFNGRYAGRMSIAEYSGFYASEHPVTGQIGQGGNVVCWV